MSAAVATRRCAVDGCGQLRSHRCWCQAHYCRWYRYGDPLGGPNASRNHYGTRKYATSRRTAQCARCRQTKRLQARGLCGACYEWVRLHGDLTDYGRSRLSSAELIEDYEWLRAAGEKHDRIAARVGWRDPSQLATHLRRHGIEVAR